LFIAGCLISAIDQVLQYIIYTCEQSERSCICSRRQYSVLCLHISVPWTADIATTFIKQMKRISHSR